MKLRIDNRTFEFALEANTSRTRLSLRSRRADLLAAFTVPSRFYPSIVPTLRWNHQKHDSHIGFGSSGMQMQGSSSSSIISFQSSSQSSSVHSLWNWARHHRQIPSMPDNSSESGVVQSLTLHILVFSPIPATSNHIHHIQEHVFLCLPTRCQSRIGYEEPFHNKYLGNSSSHHLQNFNQPI